MAWLHPCLLLPNALPEGIARDAPVLRRRLPATELGDCGCDGAENCGAGGRPFALPSRSGCGDEKKARGEEEVGGVVDGDCYGVLALELRRPLYYRIGCCCLGEGRTAGRGLRAGLTEGLPSSRDVGCGCSSG